MRKLLFTRESACIQPIRDLVEQQKHRTLVMWALECAPRFLAMYEERVPDDKRPRDALVAAASWARGDIKMPEARKAILAAHEAASAASAIPEAEAAARAVGHAAATVHVETHALGLVFYGLTALVYSAEPDVREQVVDQGCAWFLERLRFWEQNIDANPLRWAGFLLRDDVPNKERVLRQKTEERARNRRVSMRASRCCEDEG